MYCINCNSTLVSRDEDSFNCSRCRYEWDVMHEQNNRFYLLTQGRAPAAPAQEMTEKEVVETKNSFRSELNGMTVEDLRILAQDHGIDISDASRKADIIALIENEIDNPSGGSKS